MHDLPSAGPIRLAEMVHEAAGEGLLALDADGEVVAADARAAVLLGRAGQALAGRALDELVAPAAAADLRAGARDDVGLEVGGGALLARVRPLTVDGADVLAVFLRRPEDGERSAEATLERLAAQGAPARVVLVRVDNHHDLADALGHEQASRIVDGLAARLRAALPGGAVTRLASDELVAAVDARRDGGAEDLGRHVLERLGRAVDVGGLRLAVEVSAGLAALPDDARTPAELLRRAGRAARAARRERCGFLLWHARMEDAGPPRAQVVADFGRALDAGEVVFAYQPQLDLATERVVAAEALVRWRHPQRGLLAPGAFLPALERSPLMRRLALAALEDAVGQAARWTAAGLDLSVSVNLSALNLLDLGIAHDLARLLSRHHVAPGRLTLELTEDAIMVDPARAAGVLGGLHAMGVGLAVDDFGTGYSSLAYLQRLPVHELKIDRAFVRRVAQGGRDAAIVGSIVELARGLGLRSVAEGVETADQQRAVRAAGCTGVQGHLVGRPMPAERLGALAAAA